jgi:hypothetical protein
MTSLSVTGDTADPGAHIARQPASPMKGHSDPLKSEEAPGKVVFGRDDGGAAADHGWTDASSRAVGWT